ncbi:fatty acid elongase-like protein [Xylogone sp. PMI_703]|nr:fatty acid elongase-like protein [Xylogone sp. PMI_703]
MAFGEVQFALPRHELFKFPPRQYPLPLPPPAAGSSPAAPPFTIPANVFTAALDVRVPITIAAVYAVTVMTLNRYNKSRGFKAWAISKTRPFFWFVVAHNIFLAVYSAWTFIGMLRTLRTTTARWSGPGGFAGTADSLCKVHGIPDVGNAVVYDENASQWVSQNPSVHLSSTGNPDSTDLGRLWNEGLAFYGWIFYLSKFYEVLDTAIILAKGKKSSTLQTYHHAGAMMCMWAGIRYMSAPIWVFCLYTYYTLTAFSVYVPQALKRSLTTMQILQFVFGASYAALHSFVYYTIPVQVSEVEPSFSSAASAASTVVSSAVAAATSAGAASTLKKFLFRAAGEEGLAENVSRGPVNRHAGNLSIRGQTYHTEYQTVPCIDTSGQTFAIWLNVLYLAPLTWLFVRFFIRSYLRRTGPKQLGHVRLDVVENAAEDALKGLQREMFPKGNLNERNTKKH